MSDARLLKFGTTLLFTGALTLAFFGWSDLEVVGSEKAPEEKIEAVAPAVDAKAAQVEREAEAKAVGRKYMEESDACIVDPEALDDLKKQRELVAAKEKEILEKEADLKAKEQALNEEFKKLEVLRSDLGKVDVARKQENDARINKLVETFETMSPKGAAPVISGLDESLAVATMAKMATPKLAKILNAMEPKKSARLTELMAGVVRAKASTARPEMTLSDGGAEITENKEIKKGGERK